MASINLERKMNENKVLDLMKKYREGQKLVVEKSKAEIRAIQEKIKSTVEKMEAKIKSERETAKAARNQTKN